MENKKTKLIFTLMAIFTITYILWRIIFTLPINYGYISLTLGIVVILLEIWDAFDFLIHYMNILMGRKSVIKKKQINKKIKYPEIDILIATYNEDKTILEKTINGCLNLKYPDKNKLHIYVCDDGNREEIKILAKEMNVNYISRKTRKDAKAGNYNNALKIIKSPYVITLDADMIPMDDFILTIMPYFLHSKEKIGFVQLPQSFYNLDIYQKRFKIKKSIPYEQQYFYEQLQLYKNNINSAIYCGTNTAFLRQALDDVNGFATETLSEDIATGMLIQDAGYTALALPDIKVSGYSADDLNGFLKQRTRWARGCIQMLKKYKIFTCKGLNIKQKLEYFSCVSYWFFGLKRLIYLIIPIIFTLFGKVIIDCKFETFLAIWLPMYILKRIVLDLMFENKRSATWNKIYETILAPVLSVQVFLEMIGISKKEFEVSPKYNNNKNTKATLILLVPHIILFVVNLYALVICINNMPRDIAMFYFSFMWLMSNLFYLSVAIIFDVGKSPKEALGVAASCSYKLQNSFKMIEGKTIHINEDKIIINSKEKLNIGEEFNMQIYENEYHSTFKVIVMKDFQKDQYIISIKKIDTENRLLLYQIMYNRKPPKVEKYHRKAIFEIFLN